MTIASNPTYLFSIDLEDVRVGLTDGSRYQDRVALNTDIYLNFLSQYDAKCTFFVVGELARTHPQLIEKIYLAGHEIACHSYAHRPLDLLTPREFQEDLKNCKQAFTDAGISDVVGFRAPIFSLTPKTSWAYPILAEEGFRYSSSVLPSANPLYGWHGFASEPTRVEGILEVPVTLANFGVTKIPFAGGVYFRNLPFMALCFCFWRHLRQSKAPLVGYFHPYDIDTGQERFFHPGIKNSKFFNFLMYRNRDKVIPFLQRLMDRGLRIEKYSELLSRY